MSADVLFLQRKRNSSMNHPREIPGLSVIPEVRFSASPANATF